MTHALLDRLSAVARIDCPGLGSIEAGFVHDMRRRYRADDQMSPRQRAWAEALVATSESAQSALTDAIRELPNKESR
ncbi:hypothetical protein AS156_25755 [Bradyrhizobium macuxiense]|uniref:Uncharacterized protein n=1 Tax=Bradyrhizobium macuxiense TaxID=1755647 RepID=A0A109K5E5_9BRAD|nr:hypothetical protein AS156_25755 [Bradyrhizobium macuxiense]